MALPEEDLCARPCTSRAAAIRKRDEFFNCSFFPGYLAIR
jgi:hypothetical protein